MNYYHKEAHLEIKKMLTTFFDLNKASKINIFYVNNFTSKFI